eukprot:sb/3475098/
MYLLSVILTLSPGAFSACDKASTKVTNGKITWLVDSEDDSPGKITCDKKYVLNGTDIVYCQPVPDDKEPTYVFMGNCIDDGKDKTVDFRGQHYEYHFVGLNEKTKKYPLTKANTTYVITTEYTVSPGRWP